MMNFKKQKNKLAVTLLLLSCVSTSHAAEQLTKKVIQQYEPMKRGRMYTNSAYIVTNVYVFDKACGLGYRRDLFSKEKHEQSKLRSKYLGSEEWRCAHCLEQGYHVAAFKTTKQLGDHMRQGRKEMHPWVGLTPPKRRRPAPAPYHPRKGSLRPATITVAPAPSPTLSDEDEADSGTESDMKEQKPAFSGKGTMESFAQLLKAVREAAAKEQAEKITHLAPLTASKQ